MNNKDDKDDKDFTQKVISPVLMCIGFFGIPSFTTLTIVSTFGQSSTRVFLNTSGILFSGLSYLCGICLSGEL